MTIESLEKDPGNHWKPTRNSPNLQVFPKQKTEAAEPQRPAEAKEDASPPSGKVDDSLGVSFRAKRQPFWWFLGGFLGWLLVSFRVSPKEIPSKIDVCWCIHDLSKSLPNKTSSCSSPSHLSGRLGIKTKRSYHQNLRYPTKNHTKNHPKKSFLIPSHPIFLSQTNPPATPTPQLRPHPDQPEDANLPPLQQLHSVGPREPDLSVTAVRPFLVENPREGEGFVFFPVQCLFQHLLRLLKKKKNCSKRTFKGPNVWRLLFANL